MKRLLLASTLCVTSALSAQTNSINSSGNVGIGTLDPQRLLQIGPNDWAGVTVEGSNGSPNSGYFRFGDNTGWKLHFGRSRESSTSGLNTGQTGALLTIQDNGNVGIGVTNPDAALHINGGAAMSAGWNRTAVLKANYPVLAFNGVTNSWAGIGYDPGYALRFWIGGNSNDIPGTSLLAMSINPLGNVGIGTSNPDDKLVVAGRIRSVGSGSASEASVLVGDTNLNGRAWQLMSGWAGPGLFSIWDSTAAQNRLLIDVAGNVGIGTTNPTHKLAVNGTIKAKEVIVETAGWSDYVFADGYALQPLAEVEAHIKTNKHLPGIPSAAQVTTEGISVGDMQARLLAKIEELTLHQIAQEKLLKAQASELKAQLAAQADELTSLRAEVRASRK